jgi:hypothetical protein
MRGIMVTRTPAAITNIEEASTARWLARTLAADRARVLSEPSDAAVERIRARLFGERSKKERTLAA